MATPDPGRGLRGRQSERSVLDLLVSTVRAGESQTLVLRGEAGVGKSGLLDYLVGRAADCRILHAVRELKGLPLLSAEEQVPASAMSNDGAT
jgi:ABC-type transporter Mla maintaining outer membrane lipid asymmetry ATPase subunit MlaF